jgi:hypothetical protein
MLAGERTEGESDQDEVNKAEEMLPGISIDLESKSNESSGSAGYLDISESDILIDDNWNADGSEKAEDKMSPCLFSCEKSG